jgi:hypothetical protein
MDLSKVRDIRGGESVPRSKSESSSPAPWSQDHRDPKTILDSLSRLVAVTSLKADAERIVAGVNATDGLGNDGLAAAPLRAAMQVLFEICQYNSDTAFRNHVDRNGGMAAVLVRAESAWRAFGEDSFETPGPEKEKKDKPKADEAPAEGLPEPPLRAPRRK